MIALDAKLGPMEPESLVAALKAAAEPTRLRVLLLLKSGELNVKDLTQILGQSQPRLSRHLKLMSEAGLIERFREGSWVYFHISQRTPGGQLAMRILQFADIDDAVAKRDRERAEALKSEREDAAQDYFRANAAEWDSIRSLHVADADVETAMRAALGKKSFDLFVDLGTGTGRILEVFSDRFRQGVGFDVNQSMLAYARSKLSQAGLGNAQVRHGDIYNLSLPDRSADAVVMHQVLHFLSEPAHAVQEAARVLKPGGRLLIVDFAPHELEHLRDQYAHDRLGFAEEHLREWMAEAGLSTKSVSQLGGGAKDGQLIVQLCLAERSGSTPKAVRPTKEDTLEEAR